MNDQLKNYIDHNRDEFDHLDPSPDIFLKLKTQLKDKPKEKKGLSRLLINNSKWIAAASVAIVISISYLVNDNSNEQIKKIPLANNKQQYKDSVMIKNTQVNQIIKSDLKTVKTRLRRPNLPYKKSIDIPKIYRDLADSSSSSTRLAAILKIQKSEVMSYDIIDNLAKTLNHDSNSNVRLAAFNLISQYKQDNYVVNLFLQSLEKQKDPSVQLGLIEILSRFNHPKLDERLYALANDPNTLSEVKDQAYLVLLNQNKL